MSSPAEPGLQGIHVGAKDWCQVLCNDLREDQPAYDAHTGQREFAPALVPKAIGRNVRAHECF